MDFIDRQDPAGRYSIGTVLGAIQYGLSQWSECATSEPYSGTMGRHQSLDLDNCSGEVELLSSSWGSLCGAFVPHCLFAGAWQPLILLLTLVEGDCCRYRLAPVIFNSTLSDSKKRLNGEIRKSNIYICNYIGYREQALLILHRE